MSGGTTRKRPKAKVPSLFQRFGGRSGYCAVVQTSNVEGGF